MANRLMLLLISDFPHIGGAEQVALSLFRHIVSEPQYDGITLRAVTSEPGAFDSAVKEITGLNTDYIDIRGLKSKWLNPWVWRTISQSIRDTIDRHRSRPDEPVVLVFNTLWSAVAANFVIRKQTIPSVCAVHADIAPKRSLKRAFFDIAGQYLIPNITGWITVSEALSDQLQLTGISKKRIRVIPNGVDLPDSVEVIRNGAWRSALNIPAEAVVILTAGRLALDKGQHTVLESVKTLISEGLNVYLLITGVEDVSSQGGSADASGADRKTNGPYTRILQKMIQADGLQKRIILTGFVDEIQTALDESDIVASASRQESFGLSVLEAMASERPVVVSDIGGHKRLVTDGVNGFRVDPDDITDFSKALRRLITDADLRSTMGHAGRRIAENYDNKVTMNQWMDFIFEQVQQWYPDFRADERRSPE
jgi:glycosyltransferase involved in cell wall biosynthesis